jgi:hypothetical protein
MKGIKTLMAEFIFMFTHRDRTVDNAEEVLALTSGLGLTNVGFKDIGTTPQRRRDLTRAAHDLGLRVFFEIVSVDLDEELAAVDSAVDARVDWILGTTHPLEVADRVRGADLLFAPFPGKILGHPSELAGSIQEIVSEASAMASLDGVGGLDLLAYRHRTVDPVELTREVVRAVDKPVVCAGSISTAAQAQALDEAGAWGFTIGSAIFDSELSGPPDLLSQVRTAQSFADP